MLYDMSLTYGRHIVHRVTDCFICAALGAKHKDSLHAAKVGRAGLIRLLERHLSGDWGDTCESDARTNEEALHSGNRIISWYQVSKELRIMIITEADRSATTILLPEEY